MTTRFGGGYGMGYGPQMYGMGPSSFCPSCGVQGGYPMTGMPQFMGGMTPSPFMGGMAPSPFMGGMAPSPFMGGMTPSPFMGGMTPPTGFPGYGFWPGAAYGGLPAYQTTTVPDDEQIRQMIFDAIDADPLVPYDSDINVEVTGGLVTLTGSVPNKRVKHSVGDDAWWIPGVWDVNNQLELAGRARGERTRQAERTPSATSRQRPRRPSGTS